jgi:hypothetical protein
MTVAVLSALSTSPAGAETSWIAAAAPLPVTAVASTSYGLGAVTCPMVGDCVAAGEFLALENGTDTAQPVIETLSDGVWTPTAVPLISLGDGGYLSSISCAAIGYCVAVGEEGQELSQVPLIETESNGAWTATLCRRRGRCLGTRLERRADLAEMVPLATRFLREEDELQAGQDGTHVLANADAADRSPVVAPVHKCGRGRPLRAAQQRLRAALLGLATVE